MNIRANEGIGKGQSAKENAGIPYEAVERLLQNICGAILTELYAREGRATDETPGEVPTYGELLQLMADTINTSPDTASLTADVSRLSRCECCDPIDVLTLTPGA